MLTKYIIMLTIRERDDFMKRKIYNKLLEWKNNLDDIKPLMVLGARQVGKTYVINEFCKNEFDNYVHINLLQDNEIVKLYKSDKNSKDKYIEFQLLVNFDFDTPNSVIFIDEIQECEELISELKYFCEEHNNVRIICVGSLLGVKLKRSKAYKSHILTKKTTKRKRNLRKAAMTDSTNVKNMKKILPYL